ncbi:calcium-binding protein [Phyllobacterium zundukense]|jgi:Ca2+-binding RTX toxin-like protein|uniref:Uncharacterized protein n=1 Tax=Phyllobacterium zundukense TaxID=1867719 RepID=A0ACD4D785_9HYPH|nr:calcium-binding protein [Phyllobacterium zundukense]UXN61649.1 hypothetical protein N8E88_16490 [Phyllobacterium zundukense]
MVVSSHRQALLVRGSDDADLAALSGVHMVTKAIVDGTESNDILTGSDKDDIINGLAGNDVLNGFEGHDSLYGGGGSDILDGGDGNDWVDASFGDEWDDDTLYGRGGDDVLVGGYGNDRLYGGDGDDVLISGRARLEADSIPGDADGDQLFGGAGDDILVGSGMGDALYGGEGDDILIGNGGGDILHGDPGADLLICDGAVNYSASSAGVTVNLAVGLGQGGFAEGDIIRDAMDVVGSAYGDILTGNSANNRLSGNAGNDMLAGDAGDDELRGGQGNDILDGGAGDDKLIGGAGADQIDGGDGVDTMDLSHFNPALGGVTVDLVAGIASGGEVETGETFRNIENIIATHHDDVLTGDNHDNFFEVRGGADRIDGGDGIDSVLFSGSGSVFDEGLTIGLASGTVSGGNSGGSTFTNIENVIGGFGGDFIWGDSGDNMLSGSDGADRIYGGAGNDTLIGGMGAYFSENFAPASAIPGFPANDSLSGGTGADVFVFTALYDSDIPRADVISDFSASEGDKIDLRTFYAGYPQEGDPMDLTFVGYSNFSGEAGELHLVHGDTSTSLEIDVNGDLTADFRVTLVGVTEIVDGDAICF